MRQRTDWNVLHATQVGFEFIIQRLTTAQFAALANMQTKINPPATVALLGNSLMQGAVHAVSALLGEHPLRRVVNA
jgi:hypothetical protein